MQERELEKIAQRDAFGTALLKISQEDERVYVLDGDLANSTKISMVAEGNPAKFLQMGIAEQNMIGVAAGMATVGFQPWVATFAAFLSKRSLDQVQVVVAQTGLDVKMIGAYAGVLNGCAGKTHQALEDIAIMRSLVNMVVLAPADAHETGEIIKFANEYHGPVYIRLVRDPVAQVFTNDHKFLFGKAVTVIEGSDVTIISTGAQTGRALDAADELARTGISVRVLHMPTIKPLDAEAVIQAARETAAIVTTEDHSIYGGLGSAVAEVLAEHCPVPMLRNGVKDKNIQSGSNKALLEKYGISSRHILLAVEEVLKKKGKAAVSI